MQEAIQIKGAQRDEKDESKASGCRRYTNQGDRKGRIRARLKRANARRLYKSGARKGRRRTRIKRERVQRLYKSRNLE